VPPDFSHRIDAQSGHAPRSGPEIKVGRNSAKYCAPVEGSDEEQSRILQLITQALLELSFRFILHR